MPEEVGRESPPRADPRRPRAALHVLAAEVNYTLLIFGPGGSPFLGRSLQTSPAVIAAVRLWGVSQK